MNYVIRSIRADEWPAAKALRLLALQDPIAHLAFLQTYEDAVREPDSFWQQRTERASEGASEAQQIVAEGPDGEWVGTVTVLVEEAGSKDWAGFPVERKQAHLVAVFVRDDFRGIGLTEVLFDAGLEWAWGAGVERIRLLVHPDNGRAQRFYRRIGFVPSGIVVPLEPASEESELEFVLERD
ncbi:GNAT family N-acetyltransferase [Streptomyces adustus]|uniref:GNAT family N-acetyltransferase n=1 Tax=Streptomyces adustus TaxID=1609272 RepID=A0A5N8VQZ4_9ACTN|nr:GNAT family N-acetyltransferase [Streptomyces adustus]MPY37707.1 GNAT family N-acetyltransferase [Streptomyces adustus]